MEGKVKTGVALVLIGLISGLPSCAGDTVGTTGTPLDISDTSPAMISSATATAISLPLEIVEGVITNFSGAALVLNAGVGSVAVELRSGTAVERADGTVGSVGDLETGIDVRVEYNPASLSAVRIKIKQ